MIMVRGLEFSLGSNLEFEPEQSMGERCQLVHESCLGYFRKMRQRVNDLFSFASILFDKNLHPNRKAHFIIRKSKLCLKHK